MENIKIWYLWVILRLALGFLFLWAFLDKLFGLGFDTAQDKSWLLGNSPTFGFLKFGATGALGNYYQTLAGIALIDWLFMLGLLFIGASLIFGIFLKLASYTGALLMFLMWLALVPTEHNPILDEHIIYLLILLILPKIKDVKRFSLNKYWSKNSLVKNYKLLE